jgi:hypothetical protein
MVYNNLFGTCNDGVGFGGDWGEEFWRKVWYDNFCVKI